MNKLDEFIQRIKNEQKIKNMKLWHIDQCNSCIFRYKYQCLVDPSHPKDLHKPNKKSDITNKICKKNKGE